MERRIDQLEYTVMELGTEIFRLKGQLSESQGLQQRTTKVIRTLQELLVERGFLTEDDFESVTAEVLNDGKGTAANESASEAESEWPLAVDPNKPDLH